MPALCARGGSGAGRGTEQRGLGAQGRGPPARPAGFSLGPSALCPPQTCWSGPTTRWCSGSSPSGSGTTRHTCMGAACTAPCWPWTRTSTTARWPWPCRSPRRTRRWAPRGARAAPTHGSGAAGGARGGHRGHGPFIPHLRAPSPGPGLRNRIDPAAEPRAQLAGLCLPDSSSEDYTSP